MSNNPKIKSGLFLPRRTVEDYEILKSHKSGFFYKRNLIRFQINHENLDPALINEFLDTT